MLHNTAIKVKNLPCNNQCRQQIHTYYKPSGSWTEWFHIRHTSPEHLALLSSKQWFSLKIKASIRPQQSPVSVEDYSDFIQPHNRPSDIWTAMDSFSCSSKSQNWSPTWVKRNLDISRSRSAGGLSGNGSHSFRSSCNKTSLH